MSDIEDRARAIVGAAIEVHRHLGPGLLESVYRRCVGRELELRGVPYQEEVALEAGYKGMRFDSAYRVDLLVAGKIVVELKVVEKILPVHEAQLLSYLRLSGKSLGFLINFHVPVLKQGIRRIVNDL